MGVLMRFVWRSLGVGLGGGVFGVWVGVYVCKCRQTRTHTLVHVVNEPGKRGHWTHLPPRTFSVSCYARGGGSFGLAEQIKLVKLAGLTLN